MHATTVRRVMNHDGANTRPPRGMRTIGTGLLYASVITLQ
jgi:hypothetical protein